MPKVTITGSTEQVANAMGLRPIKANPRRKNGTSEQAIKNKMRGDAQRVLTDAFRAVRNDPMQDDLCKRLLAAIRTVEMPSQDTLVEAESLLNSVKH